MNCAAGDWGFCYHQEYGKCIHAENKSNNMKKTYSLKELLELDIIQLIELAEKLQIEKDKHLNKYDLIRAIREKQHQVATEEKQEP